MRSEGYSSRSVCLFVCLSVCDYSPTTGYEAAYERYQQLQCYKGKEINLAILLKRLLKEIWLENERKSINYAFSLVFTPYLSNAVVSAKSPN